MIIRLTVLTTLLAFFAVSFGSLVRHEGRANAHAWSAAPSGNCLDRGLFCSSQAN